MRPDVRALVVVLLGGCVGTAECDRRVAAAHRDALRDAELCFWNPKGLGDAECRGLDRAPLLTYYGVWCSTAPLPCIRANPEAEPVCFGEPDTDPVDATSAPR